MTIECQKTQLDSPVRSMRKIGAGLRGVSDSLKDILDNERMTKAGEAFWMGQVLTSACYILNYPVSPKAERANALAREAMDALANTDIPHKDRLQAAIGHTDKAADLVDEVLLDGEAAA